MKLPPELRRILFGRKIEITLSEALEHRVRLDMDRFNAWSKKVGEEDDLLDLDSDEDIATALEALIERGLDESERDVGLGATIFGEVMSRDVLDAGRAERMAAFRKRYGLQDLAREEDDDANTP